MRYFCVMSGKYSAEIKALERCIMEMEQMKDIMFSLQEAALNIEKELCDIDASLPLKDDINSFVNEKERARLEKALELLKQAFYLIDELLGPPQDDITGELEGTTFSPEARGNGQSFSIDEMLDMIKFQSKTHTS